MIGLELVGVNGKTFEINRHLITDDMALLSDRGEVV